LAVLQAASAQPEPSALQPAEAAVAAWVAAELPRVGAGAASVAAELPQVEAAAARAVWAVLPLVGAARPSEVPRAADLSAVASVCRPDRVLPWAVLAPLPRALLAHAMASERIASL
jgi:hypothetical protein